jgi:hypothetical protein
MWKPHWISAAIMALGCVKTLRVAVVGILASLGEALMRPVWPGASKDLGRVKNNLLERLDAGTLSQQADARKKVAEAQKAQIAVMEATLRCFRNHQKLGGSDPGLPVASQEILRPTTQLKRKKRK